MKKVAVFFGGKSSEREISILTGLFVLSLLDREKYEPIPLYMHLDGGIYSTDNSVDLNDFKDVDVERFDKVVFVEEELYKLVKKGKKQTLLKPCGTIDVALNCCHGGLGEGGGVSALAQLNEIPFASPCLTGSGAFMDKAFTKIVLRGLNIPHLDFVRVEEKDFVRRGKFLIKNVGKRLGYPVVVKPAKQGSSIGITLAKTEEELENALLLAFELDDKAVIEKYLDGKLDVNCAVYTLNGEIVVSEPEIASSDDGVYSFSDKYLKDGRQLRGKRGRGGNLGKILTQRIKAYTKTVYKKCDLFGVVRMDYLVKDDEVYLSEVNTVPGSLAYYLFCERLVDAKAFFTDLIEEGLRKAEGKDKLLPQTGILKDVKFTRNK